jgi:hypothetical protein
MKSVFDKTTRTELTERIRSLDVNSKAVWGRMNVFQMLRHCALWEEMMLGRKKYGRVFIGRLFGQAALKSILKDGQILRRNTPTIPELKISGDGDVLVEKAKWIELIEQHPNNLNIEIVHPFFGRMSREQIGLFVYMHADHHLRQFNA